VGDGASVSATADAIADDEGSAAATVVPLCGGYWFGDAAREPFRRIADALGATAQGLLAPGLVDDAATKQALYGHAGIRTVLDLWGRLDVALFGIGARAWSEATLGSSVTRTLDEGGAVGEVLIAPFDANGRFVCDSLRERVIAFDARRLTRVPVTIGVAGGPAKVTPILGALRAGVINTLVTDASTAEAIAAAASSAAV
jgi:DNA-binding transcriptional regulator LsrR (DeoR family)